MEDDSFFVGRSQWFPKGASKQKTAARKAAKVAQRKSFLELISDANQVLESQPGSEEVSLTRAADGALLQTCLAQHQQDQEKGKKKRPAQQEEEEEAAVRPRDIKKARCAGSPSADQPDGEKEAGAADLKKKNKKKKAARGEVPERKQSRISGKGVESEEKEEKEEEEEVVKANGSGDGRQRGGGEDVPSDSPPGSVARPLMFAPSSASSSSWASWGDIPGGVVPSRLVRVLREDLQLLKPTPIQAQSWPVSLSGLDVVAVAVTGSGKTLAFLLPAFTTVIREREAAKNGVRTIEVDAEFQRPDVTWAQATPSVIILAPTRELVQQIATSATELAAAAESRVALVYGGASKAQQASCLREGAEVVVAAPGRLRELLAVGPPPASWRPCVSAHRCRLLVLDEADRCLDMGFEPQITQIVRHCPKTAPARLRSTPSSSSSHATTSTTSTSMAPSGRQTLLFSATWPEAVKRIAHSVTCPTTTALLRVTTGGTCGAHSLSLAACSDIHQTVVLLQKDSEKEEKLLQILRRIEKEEKDKEALVIVFVETKKRCSSLASTLQSSSGVPRVVMLHGDMPQEERDTALQAFKSGGARVLVATEVAARGLDLPRVSTVLLRDFPSQGVLQYIHRIGRTARAGASGRAVTLFTPSDRRHAPALLQLLQEAAANVPPGLEQMAEEVLENPPPVETLIKKKKGYNVKGKKKKRGF